MNYLNDPTLQSSQTDAQSAEQTYANATQAGFKLPDLLKEALTKKFSSSENPLMADLESARSRVYSDMGTAPTQVMEPSAGVIFSPNQQASLISKYRAPGIAKLAGAQDMFNLGTGGLQNIIDSVTRNQQSQTAGLKSTAEQKRQSYTDLLSLMKAQTEEDWTGKEFDEKKRQFDEEQKTKRETDVSNDPMQKLIEQYLVDQLAGKTTYQPTETKPTKKPTKGKDILGRADNPNRLYSSPQGQWIFDWETNDWVPVVD
jgi:hypothetical protein